MKARVGVRGTLVIPKEIRERQGIREAGLLEIVVKKDKIIPSRDKLILPRV